MRRAPGMGFVILLLCAPLVLAEGLAPGVLFYGGGHSRYVVQPLHEMGFELGICPRGKLARALKENRFNVVVVSTMSEAERKVVSGFLAKGGGVFVCNPEIYQREEWGLTNEWLAKLGARPRWELLQDADNKNVVRDVMGARLSWSDQVFEPVNDGVKGVLTLVWGSTTGIEPPMSLDFGPEWTVVARGAASMKGKAEKRHDVPLQPWIPKALAGPSPALMGVREVGKGRLAVMGIRKHWLFSPPANCPTAEAMLTAGAGGRPSHWLRVLANTFRWLAGPSLKLGIHGAPTPESLLHPSVKVWPLAKTIPWSDLAMPKDQPQNAGLVGARTSLSSGTGTVKEFAEAAKKAGLQFLVFLENSLKMDAARWGELVKDCKAASGKSFLAVPGLTYEDAQGNHHFAFADQVKFPKPGMLLPDGRLATIQRMRSRAYFDYDNEYLQQKAIRGFWNHKKNFLHFADYKLYNAFPIFSFDEEGKRVDDALNEYLYLQGIGGAQAALAFEFMDRPEEVSRRAATGWRVICHRSLGQLDGLWHRGAFSFSGSGSQYITNGPRILVWRSPNRLCEPHGEWWRPDIWEYRLSFKVASDAGLKTVTLHDGDREVFRRWRPNGARVFQQQLVLYNGQQRGFTLVVEDLKGRRAVSMSFWNRNLNNEEFFCSDRCNFLGNARLRTRKGRTAWTQVSFQANMGITPSKGRLDIQAAPALNLTFDSPTLPIDGAPAGFRASTLRFGPHIPGETILFAYPQTYQVGPEIGIGQADIFLGYDPAEKGAKKTPLGHAYEQPQDGWGNAWGSWHRLVPTRKVKGWARLYACTWLPETFRIGWFETRLTAKDEIEAGPNGLTVLTATGALRDKGRKVIAKDGSAVSGIFGRGVFLTEEARGGATMVFGTSDDLAYTYQRGNLRVYYKPGKTLFQKGDSLGYSVAFAGASAGTTTAKMLEFAGHFGITRPGFTAYEPQLKQGKMIDNYLAWILDGEGKGISASLPRTQMPGFLPAIVKNLNDNWSVWLVDKKRPWPNCRGLPIRGGVAYAQLDLNLADMEVFIGHPVVAKDPRMKILVSWMKPGAWFVEVHNPLEEELQTTVETAPAWTPFRFLRAVALAPGESKVWTVKEPQ